ncbi:MAG TPA: response regulator [Candidatus Angelobacter sp.]|jgi:DNA-binding response OmpR family regulator|nr:response regulator [Candidatus Angelobacter sp.]
MSFEEHSSQTADTSRPESQPCVLLVEDDRSVRRYLEVTLQRSGYTVITAADGLEAMKLALSAHVDVVVTDAIMPNLNGHELARFLRSHQKLSHLPIVLLTGQENKVTANTTEKLIDAFLYKPVKANELTACLASLLSEKPGVQSGNLVVDPASKPA